MLQTYPSIAILYSKIRIGPRIRFISTALRCVFFFCFQTGFSWNREVIMAFAFSCIVTCSTRHAYLLWIRALFIHWHRMQWRIASALRYARYHYSDSFGVFPSRVWKFIHRILSWNHSVQTKSKMLEQTIIGYLT